MKIDLWMLAIIAVAAFVVLVGPGAFMYSAVDGYYDHTLIYEENLTYGQPIILTVAMTPKDINFWKLCDYNYPPGRQPDATHFCASFTYLNARSIRVSIDGQEYENLYFYPATEQGGVELYVPPAFTGAEICCFDTCGQACSVCADQARTNRVSERPYLFYVYRGTNDPLPNGSVMFRLTLPESLENGNHTIELKYLAETGGRPNDNACGIAYWSSINQQTMTGRNVNNDANYRYVFNVVVSGKPGTIPPIPPPEPVVNVTPPTEPPIIPPVIPPNTTGNGTQPPSNIPELNEDTSSLVIGLLALGAFFGYELFVKKK